MDLIIGWYQITLLLLLKPTPLAPKKDIPTIIDSVKPIDELFQFAPIDEMKVALDKHINPNADDSDSSDSTSFNFGTRMLLKKVAVRRR